MTKTISVRNIDDDLWQKFRVVCLLNNESVSDRLNLLIEKDVKANS